MVIDGARSVSDDTGWYLVVLGHCKAVLVGTWWYWTSLGRYWLVIGGIVSVGDDTGWCLVILSQNRAAFER